MENQTHIFVINLKTYIMKKFASLFVAALFSVASFAQTSWNVDPMHSSLNFAVKHMGISFVDGRFDKYEGEYSGPSSDITKGSFHFKVHVESINTGVEMRDKHLLSPDFFNAEKHQTITFDSTKITPVKDSKNQYTLEGVLTMNDIKNPVVFTLTHGGHLKDDGNGLQRMGFQAKTTLNRFDYKISYDEKATAIAKDVDLVINLEFTTK